MSTKIKLKKKLGYFKSSFIRDRVAKPKLKVNDQGATLSLKKGALSFGEEIIIDDF